MFESQEWLWAVVAILSAVVGGYCGAYIGRRTSKQQSTLIFMKDYNGTVRISDGHKVLHAAQGKEAEEILQDKSFRSDFLFLMNEFEILAIGLNRGIYDKNMVIDFFGRDIREIYDKSKILIETIRKNESDNEAFEKFEELAKSIRTKHHFTLA